MIDNLQVIRTTSKNPVSVYCTYCWQQHNGYKLGDTIILSVETCGTDPSRYFLDRNEYQKAWRELTLARTKRAAAMEVSNDSAS